MQCIESGQTDTRKEDTTGRSRPKIDQWLPLCLGGLRKKVRPDVKEAVARKAPRHVFPSPSLIPIAKSSAGAAEVQNCLAQDDATGLLLPLLACLSTFFVAACLSHLPQKGLIVCQSVLTPQSVSIPSYLAIYVQFLVSRLQSKDSVPADRRTKQNCSGDPKHHTPTGPSSLPNVIHSRFPVIRPYRPSAIFAHVSIRIFPSS